MLLFNRLIPQIMTKGRIEAFSDGVLAIIITIMVLEMKVPEGTDLSSLKPVLPIFGGYLLSFIYLGIYWNNHHHLFQSIHIVNGRVLWANLHLLFWLSLIPFATGWMGENQFAKIPVVLYGFVLLMSGLAYFLLSKVLIQTQEEGSKLAQAYGKDFKGIISLIIYVIAILVSLISSWVGCVLFVLVAALWIVPDKRIERLLLN